MVLHAGTDVVGNVLRVFAVGLGIQVGQTRYRAVGRIGWQMLVRVGGLVVADDVVARSTPEDQQVQQGVGAQAVRAVHADAGAFADRVQPIHRLALVIGVLRDDLTMDIGRYATHLVMDSWHHRNRLFGDVHIGKVVADLKD